MKEHKKANRKEMKKNQRKKVQRTGKVINRVAKTLIRNITNLVSKAIQNTQCIQWQSKCEYFAEQRRMRICKRENETTKNKNA